MPSQKKKLNPAIRMRSHVLAGEFRSGRSHISLNPDRRIVSATGAGVVSLRIQRFRKHRAIELAS
jgi:hypothetical protein